MNFRWSEDEKNTQLLDCEFFKKKYYFFNPFFDIELSEKTKEKCNKFSLGYYNSNFLKNEEKHYTLKTFYVENKSDNHKLLNYLNGVEILSRSHKNLMKILNYCINEKNNSILVILDKKWNTLDFHKQTLSEMEFILVLRKMMDLLFGLESSSPLFSMINALGVRIWDMKNMCYYRKFWQKRRRLPNYKLKVDFLNFNDQNVELKKSGQSSTLNLNELSEFIRDFMPLGQLSLPIRDLVIKIEDKNQKITINDLRKHPLFMIHKYQNIDLEKWKITEECKKKLYELKRVDSDPKSPENLYCSRLRCSVSKKEFISTESPEKITYLKKNSKIMSRTEKSKDNSHQYFEKVEEILKSAKYHLTLQFTKKKLDQHISEFINGFLESEQKRLKQKRYKETQAGNDVIKYYNQNPKKFDIKNLVIVHQIISEEDYNFLCEAQKKRIY